MFGIFRVNSIIAISHLDDTNSVSNIKGIKVLCEANISLLLTIRSDEGVHGLNLDVVQGLNGILDLLLGSKNIADEGEGVDVLNLLHSCFSCKWRNNNAIIVHLVEMSDRLTRVLWCLRGLSGLGHEEVHVASNLLDGNGLSLLQSLGSRGCLGHLG